MVLNKSTEYGLMSAVIRRLKCCYAQRDNVNLKAFLAMFCVLFVVGCAQKGTRVSYEKLPSANFDVVNDFSVGRAEFSQRDAEIIDRFQRRVGYGNIEKQTECKKAIQIVKDAGYKIEKISSNRFNVILESTWKVEFRFGQSDCS
jgi:hypothetical protein